PEPDQGESSPNEEGKTADRLGKTPQQTYGVEGICTGQLGSRVVAGAGCGGRIRAGEIIRERCVRRVHVHFARRVVEIDGSYLGSYRWVLRAYVRFNYRAGGTGSRI